MFANDGADNIGGGSGRDDIRGGNGDDILSGSKNPDKISGDASYAADGEADYIDCGNGTDDKAFVDQLDTQIFDCETVTPVTVDPPA